MWSRSCGASEATALGHWVRSARPNALGLYTIAPVVCVRRLSPWGNNIIYAAGTGPALCILTPATHTLTLIVNGAVLKYLLPPHSCLGNYIFNNRRACDRYCLGRAQYFLIRWTLVTSKVKHFKWSSHRQSPRYFNL